MAQGLPLWFSLDAVVKYDTMPSFATLIAEGLLTADEPRFALFVSHPWETREHPDPSHTQWLALKKLLTHMFDFMIHDSSAQHPFQPFSYLNTVESIYAAALTHNDFTTSEKSVRYLYSEGRYVSGLGLPDRFLQRAASGERAEVPANKRRLRRRFAIWLDYCCLPQQPCTSAEARYVREMLPQLCYLASRAVVIALWPDESKQADRAWCVAEAAVFYCARGVHPVVPSEIGGQTGVGKGFRELGSDTRARIEMMTSLAKAARTVEIFAQVMEQEGLRCSAPRDLPVTAAAVFASIHSVARLGIKAVGLRVVTVILEVLWWTTHIYLVPVHWVLIRAIMLVGGDRPDEILDRLLRSLWEGLRAMTLFSLLVIWGAVMIYGALLDIVLSPIELARRSALRHLGRERSNYIRRATDEVA